MDRTLLIIVYLSIVIVIGSLWQKMLADTIKAIKKLAATRYIIVLKKLQLVWTSAKILGHLWTLGAY